MLDKVPLTMRRAVLADCDAVLRLQAAADADLQVAQGLYSRVCNLLYAGCHSVLYDSAMHAAAVCWSQSRPAAASNIVLCACTSATLSSCMTDCWQLYVLQLPKHMLTASSKTP